MKPGRHPYLLLTLASLLWSGNFLIGRAVHGQIPPVALAFWRWAGASLLVLLPALPHLRKDWSQLKGHWPILLLLSAIGIAAFNTLIYTGLQWTQAINAFLLQSMMPVLIVAMSFVLFRETIGPRQIIAIFISLTGAVTIIVQGTPSALFSLSINRGDILVLVAVVCYAAYSTLLRKRPPIHPLSFIALTFILGAAMLTPFYLQEILAGKSIQFTPATVPALVYVAIFPSIVAYLCYNRGVEVVGANRAGLFIHLMPIFGSLLAIILLNETMRWYHGVGITLIAAGILLATRSSGKSIPNPGSRSKGPQNS